ncbi:MAG: hypothetical protein V3T86_09710 [Planctomycetota bacterium]
MRTHNRAWFLAVGVMGVMLSGCTGNGPATNTETAAIFFETDALPAGGTGQLYEQVLSFVATGDAPLPDRFEVENGVLPDGLRLLPETDASGVATGRAMVVGFPREAGDFNFFVRAVSTSSDPALAAVQEFDLRIGDGSVAILTPTAAEGTTDPKVLAFPESIDFVNPQNAQAFFSFAFLVAGGSGQNELNIYLPRELELSVFDDSVADASQDTDESGLNGNKFDPNTADGGWFVATAGDRNVQVGGFQSPRGPVGTISPLDAEWFQASVSDGGAPLSSRRDFADTLGLSGGDNLLIPGRLVQFSDYFSPAYVTTQPSDVGSAPRRKYPFGIGQYANVFQLPPTSVTTLRYHIIVEAIDTDGTSSRFDDQIDRRAYIVHVKIPDIRIGTIFLPDGQAGIDYNEFVAASGGVPPLQFELEHVDGVADFEITPNGQGDVDRTTVGLGFDATLGQFLGVPRVSAQGLEVVELSVRVSAAVMNPTQDGQDGLFDTTSNQGESQGLHPITGKRGLHRTYQVRFAAPTAPSLTNTCLAPGVDGVGYPGDALDGVGGVPNLVPDPVTFVGIYPSDPARNYSWGSSFRKDTSHGSPPPSDPALGLPNFLTLDGDIESITNGNISGSTMDRGFHRLTISQEDDFDGSVSNHGDANRQRARSDLLLSVSPDDVRYIRGVSATEAAGGEPSGLASPSTQMGDPRNVPLAMAGGLFRGRTGSPPELYTSLPPAWDILPVMLAHGGDDEHLDKSRPSISGFWPAESNSELNWNPNADRAWAHLQQEFTWVQLQSQRRVFLWGETEVVQFNEGSTVGQGAHRYQEFRDDGQRGILMVDPISGDFWVPAILDRSPGHGTQFGAEVVVDNNGTDGGGRLSLGYWRKDRNGVNDSRPDRAALSVGLGTYIEGFQNTTGNSWHRHSMGRTAISVAMSADGLWGATAMPGGDSQKILLWRTDKEPIPDAILEQDFAVGLTGRDADGDPLPNSSVILNIGGEDAGETTLSNDQHHLLPDSLCFVDGGLLFLNETQFDHVFGVSLVDGHLSSIEVEESDPDTGFYVPDQDYMRGAVATSSFAVQFAFSGDEPEPGTTGPDTVAFVAGSNRMVRALDDLPGRPRSGYVNKGNSAKRLYVMNLDPDDEVGLDLGDGAELIDRSEADPDVLGGDLLTPGRMGEELDFLKMSPDGRFVAVVRDLSARNSWQNIEPTFATPSSSTNTAWHANLDLLVFATDPEDDLDAARTGVQHALFLGTNRYGTGNPGGLPTGASGRNHLNGFYRRIWGLTFGSNRDPDGERSLIFNYSGETVNNSRSPMGSGWAVNWGGVNHSSAITVPMGTGHVNLRFEILDDEGSPNSFTSPTLDNTLEDIENVGNVGPTSRPYAGTGASVQQFWSMFKSHNGNFLYYVSDPEPGRNFMVGYNISGETINGHEPYEAFVPHADNVGFEQIDVNAFNYESRFYAVPGGVDAPGGDDGAGLVFFVASAPSATATSATDLEVYVFDADRGGDAVVLTSGVTPGGTNAINHLHVSADGDVLIAQRSATGSNSRTSRASLNGNSDLIAITNVHDALAGDVPISVVVSEGASHGATVALVGQGTANGPRAVVFSSADSGDNRTWDDRTLKLGLLQPGCEPVTLDPTRSFYGILSAHRVVSDNPTTSD